MDSNHNLFDEWTEESAYIFGFWLADGSIYTFKKGHRYYKRFRVHNTEKQIIDDLNKILNGPVSVRRLSPPRLPIYRIEIYSDCLFDFCYAITRTIHKSETEVQLPDIPNKLFHHLIRGFFDGDGSIHLTTYKNRHGKPTTELRTSFTAGKDTGDFLEKLRNKMQLFIPVGMKKIAGETGKSDRKLQFGQYDSMLLCEWIYKDATIYMKRKKKIWDQADKEKLMNSKKYFSNKV